MITWNDYISAFMRQKIKECGGTNACARRYNMDKAVVSKIARGKYIPKRSSMVKVFGEDIPETIEVIKEV